MSKFTLRSVPLVVALCVLTACGSTPPKPGSTAKDPESAYAEARALFEAGSYESAITAYEQLEARFPYGRHAQQAQLDTAYTHYLMRQPEVTIADCERFIRLHPSHPNVDYAYYLKALSYENTKSEEWLSFLPQQPLAERDGKAINNAFETFKIIVTRYPQSQYLEDSRAHMQTLLEALAAHELSAARYYLARRAPLAAANRAQIVVTKYGASSATEEALALMLKSYQSLKLDTLSSDTERVLRQNYPNSRFLTQK